MDAVSWRFHTARDSVLGKGFSDSSALSGVWAVVETSAFAFARWAGGHLLSHYEKQPLHRAERSASKISELCVGAAAVASLFGENWVGGCFDTEGLEWVRWVGGWAGGEECYECGLLCCL